MIQETLTEGMEPVENFKCIHCQLHLPMTDMSTDSHHTVRYECKPCRAVNATIVRQLKKKHLGSLPTMDDSCPICNRTGQEIRDRGSFQKRKPWTLDHCHDTNTFRGWVCHKCNTGLGGFNDDLTIVKNAVSYLLRHKEKINENST